jgi:hypothetical protein
MNLLKRTLAGNATPQRNPVGMPMLRALVLDARAYGLFSAASAFLRDLRG